MDRRTPWNKEKEGECHKIISGAKDPMKCQEIKEQKDDITKG